MRKSEWQATGEWDMTRGMFGYVRCSAGRLYAVREAVGAPQAWLAVPAKETRHGRVSIIKPVTNARERLIRKAGCTVVKVTC